MKVFHLLNFKEMSDELQTCHGGKQLDCSSFNGKIKQYGELVTVLLCGLLQFQGKNDLIFVVTPVFISFNEILPM